MQKITFENLPSTNTPLNASNLNTLQDNVENAINDMVNVIYPVGSIYMSVNNTNPSTLFGGTWQQLEDRFLLGAGTTYTAGNTGGEATHTLTTSEMPSHTHVGREYGYGNSSWHVTTSKNELVHKSNIPSATEHTYESVSNAYIFNGAESHSTGDGQAHNNMPPYLVVYMWKRTA